MPFTDSDLRALEPREKQYRVATGDGLYVVVYPNGSKYFTWVYRYPPGRGGQQRWHHIGPYGKGSGKWSLKAARFACCKARALCHWPIGRHGERRWQRFRGWLPCV